MGDANTLVVCYLDRLHRNLADLMDTIKLADAQGWSLIILDLGGEPVDTKTAIGRLIIQVLGAVAEMQSNMTSERVKASMDKMKEEGYVFGPSRRISDELSNHICALYNSGMTYAQVARRLEEEGHITAHGNAHWCPKSLRNHVAWRMGDMYSPHPAHR